MDFSYPPHVEQLRGELRAWLGANLTDEIVRAGRGRDMSDAEFEVRRAWDATVADAGWGAMSWPQEYGGRGASALEQLVHAEEITRARTPLPLNVIGINNIGPAIMQYGTDAQKRELLPRMVRADDIWCQGMSEPEAFKWIQRAAMDRRTTMKRVAEVVLETLDPAAEGAADSP